MFTDKNLLLSDTRAVTTGGIDTASCINIGASRDLWDGTPLRVAFSPVTGPAGGTSIDFQVIASIYPVTIQTGSAVTVTSAAPGVFTLAAHGMQAGTPFYLSSGTAPTGLSNGTVYYASNITTNTFTASTTIANALAGTAITTSSTGTSVVIDPYAVIVGSSTAVPIALFTGKSIMVTCSPTIGVPSLVGGTALSYTNGRVVSQGGAGFTYLQAKYLCAGTFTGTAFTASIVMQAGTAQKSYPTGVLIS